MKTQHGVANHVNGNDYEYDKRLKEQNRDANNLRNQIAALEGVVTDAGRAKRARLQAQLAEAEQDLKDTRQEHQWDLESQGYDQLSEDIQKSLKEATELLNGNQAVLQATVTEMLGELKTNAYNEEEMLRTILRNATGYVHAGALSALNETLGSEGGLIERAAEISTAVQMSGYDIIQYINANAADINDWMNTLHLSAQLNAEQTVTSIDSNAISINANNRQISEELKQNYNEKFESLQSNTVATINGVKQATNTASTTNHTDIQRVIDTMNAIDKNLPKVADVNKIYTSVNGVASKIDGLGTSVNKAVTYLQANINEIQSTQKKLGDNIQAAISIAQSAVAAAGNAGSGSGGSGTGGSAPSTTPKQQESSGDNYEKAKQEASDLFSLRNQIIDSLVGNDAALQENVAIRQAVVDGPGTKKEKDAVLRGYEATANEYIAQYGVLAAQYNDVMKQIADIFKKHGIDYGYATMNTGQYTSTYPIKFASGTKRVPKDLFAWTQEEGSELIVRPSDGAILTPLKANDAVIPADLTNNLFKWGAINPDNFATNPFMGKWGEPVGGSSSSDVLSNNTSTQNVDMHFDSLIHIDGNADATTVTQLEDLAKQLTKNKDFQQNVINFVTKNYVKESKKQGFR